MAQSQQLGIKGMIPCLKGDWKSCQGHLVLVLSFAVEMLFNKGPSDNSLQISGMVELKLNLKGCFLVTMHRNINAK